MPITRVPLSVHHRQDGRVITQTVFPAWEAKSLYRQASGRGQVRTPSTPIGGIRTYVYTGIQLHTQKAR